MIGGLMAPRDRPQLDQHAWDENAPTVRKIYNPAEKGILDFLDEAVGKYGKRCMAFVRSVGSLSSLG